MLASVKPRARKKVKKSEEYSTQYSNEVQGK